MSPLVTPLVMCNKNRKIFRKQTNFQDRTSWTSIPWTSAIFEHIRHGSCTDCQQRLLTASQVSSWSFVSLLCLPHVFSRRCGRHLMVCTCPLETCGRHLMVCTCPLETFHLLRISNVKQTSLTLRNLLFAENQQCKTTFSHFERSSICWESKTQSNPLSLWEISHLLRINNVN